MNTQPFTSESREVSIELDPHTAAAIEWIAMTRGVSAEAFCRACVEWCTAKSVEQGPGEVIESFIEAAEDYGNPEPDSFWNYGIALERLEQCIADVKRIKARQQSPLSRSILGPDQPPQHLALWRCIFIAQDGTNGHSHGTLNEVLQGPLAAGAHSISLVKGDLRKGVS